MATEPSAASRPQEGRSLRRAGPWIHPHGVETVYPGLSGRGGGHFLSGKRRVDGGHFEDPSFSTASNRCEFHVSADVTRAP